VQEKVKGVFKLNEPLAPHTSWHVGGHADKYYCPSDIADLAHFLTTLSIDEPITWLGLGSNVLISDEGIRGVVIHMLPPQSYIPGLSIETLMSGDNLKHLRVEAGITCAKLARFCAKNGLVGAEFFAGIPGTVGGALAMNAGAWGGETWRHVVKVEVINRQGKTFFRNPSEYQINYRTVNGPQEEWFIAGYFQFKEGDAEASSQKIKELLRQRNTSQPIGVFSCGSVFKNPEGDHAGRLIEASNLKGYIIGGAQVSPKHANFILNLGNAKAKDILQLIEHIRAVVLKDHHIHLQPEVRLLGF